MPSSVLEPKRGLGWLPDKPDARDYEYSQAIRSKARRLFKAPMRPREMDLRGDMWPAIFDQGPVGSCVAQSWVAALSAADARFQKEGHGLIFSRLGLYFDTRQRIGTFPDDSGSSIRDGIKTVETSGIGSEDLWPYDPERFNIQPPDEYYLDGVHRRNRLLYARINSMGELLDCIASGWGAVFGMTLHESFMYGAFLDNVVPLPGPDEGEVGGHAMVAIGYRPGQVLLRNSWGPTWADQGHAWIRIPHLERWAGDFWTVRRIIR